MRLICLSLFLILLASVQSFKFLSVGDWGDKEFRQTLSQEFDKRGKDAPVALFLGDNFYEAGVRSVFDSQWEAKYQASFTGENLKNAKFLVLAGNHDYYGNVTAQVEYQDKTRRWTFPSLYHTRQFKQDGVSVTFVMLDTWTLNGGDTLLAHDPATGKTWLRSNQALVQAIVDGHISPKLAQQLKSRFPLLSRDGLLESVDFSNRDPAQMDWLKRTLKESNSDWTFVCGHFPIRSSSKNEHGDTKQLVKVLEPVLLEYKVDAYFAGHDHILQVLHRDGAGLRYYGSGAGARKHSNVNENHEGLKGYVTDSTGFMTHELTRTKMTTKLIDDGGNEVFTYVQEKKVKPVIMASVD